MPIVGIRAAAQEIRYAILNKADDGNVVFINRDEEHRLKYPATIQSIEEKLNWVNKEFERVFRKHPSIDSVIIKVSEYTGNETSSKREAAYVDAVILLLAAEKNIPVERKLYSQTGTTANQTKEHAESRVGKTEKYWNNTIADAINCAFWEIRRS
jgi:hypothetical protein